MIYRKPLHTDEVLQRASAIAQKYLADVRGVEFFLFGSRASGKYNPTSDYDFGIIAPSKLDIGKFFALKDELEEIPVLQKIDVVDFSNVPERFKAVAAQHTKVLFKN